MPKLHYLDLFWISYNATTMVVDKVKYTAIQNESADTTGTVMVPWAGHFQC